MVRIQTIGMEPVYSRKGFFLSVSQLFGPKYIKGPLSSFARLIYVFVITDNLVIVMSKEVRARSSLLCLDLEFVFQRSICASSEMSFVKPDLD